MKIECKLKRPGGSIIELGKDKYHFKPDANDAHVCDVENEDHIERLLSIKEAYKVYGEEDPEEEMLDDSESAPLTPENMDNDDLNAWATERGINPKSKKSIADYALEMYEVELEYDGGVTCAALIRELVSMDLEEAKEG